MPVVENSLAKLLARCLLVELVSSQQKRHLLVCLIKPFVPSPNTTIKTQNQIFLRKCIMPETFEALINPLLLDVPFLYPLKISGNLRFSDILRGYKKGTPGSNGFI